METSRRRCNNLAPSGFRSFQVNIDNCGCPSKVEKESSAWRQIGPEDRRSIQSELSGRLPLSARVQAMLSLGLRDGNVFQFDCRVQIHMFLEERCSSLRQQNLFPNVPKTCHGTYSTRNLSQKSAVRRNSPVRTCLNSTAKCQPNLDTTISSARSPSASAIVLVQQEIVVESRRLHAVQNE